MPDLPQIQLAHAAQLIDVVGSITQELTRAASSDGRTGTRPERVVLDAYVRALRALRAVAMEARGRVERTATVVTEAETFARRRRRRAGKATARLRAKTREGPR